MIWFDLFSPVPSNRLQTTSGCKQESVCRQRMMEVRGRKMKAVLRLEGRMRTESMSEKCCKTTICLCGLYLQNHKLLNKNKVHSSVWYSKQTLQHAEKWGLKCEICKTIYIMFGIWTMPTPMTSIHFYVQLSAQRFIFFKKIRRCMREGDHRLLLFKV